MTWKYKPNKPFPLQLAFGQRVLSQPQKKIFQKGTKEDLCAGESPSPNPQPTSPSALCAIWTTLPASCLQFQREHRTREVEGFSPSSCHIGLQCELLFIPQMSFLSSALVWRVDQVFVFRTLCSCDSFCLFPRVTHCCKYLSAHYPPVPPLSPVSSL